MDQGVRILGINASPRTYGNTYRLLRIALEVAKRSGAKVQLINLYEYEIKPCLGCLSDIQKACRYPCVIDDDGREILAKILEADGVIFATPIYWYGPSGHLKNLIDRMTSLENMIFIDGRSWAEGKVCGIIAVGNDSGAIMAISYLMVTFNSMGFAIPPWALAYFNKVGNVLSNSETLLDAANVGLAVYELTKRIKDKHTWYDSNILKEVGSDLVQLVNIESKENKKSVISSRYREITKLIDENEEIN